MHERLVNDLTTELKRKGTLNRRQFLQLATAVAAGELVVSQLGPFKHALASAGGGGSRNDGILLLINMSGGNDGLNTVVPITDPRYVALRANIALDPAQVNMLSSDTALHPSLVRLTARYAAGDVAVLRNAGYTPQNFSHFQSGDLWASGRGTGGTAGAVTTSGWLGRWSDTLGTANAMQTVAFGSSTPPHLRGVNTRALAIPLFNRNYLGSSTNADEVRLYGAVRSLAGASTGFGSMADALAQTNVEALDASTQTLSAYSSIPSGSSLQRQMIMAANLINSGLGVRVLSASFGSFDTHATQGPTHAALLADLDNSIDQFYARLTPTQAARVTILTWSEFGRRPQSNDSAGTDHGAASCMFAIGTGVRGGIYGDPAPLGSLVGGNMVATMDFRQVYSSVLSGWLGADPTAIVGSSYGDLKLFTTDGVVTTTTSAPTTTAATTTTALATTSTTGSSSTTAPSTTVGTSSTTSPSTTVGSSSTTSPSNTTSPSSTTSTTAYQPPTTQPVTTQATTTRPSTTAVRQPDYTPPIGLDPMPVDNGPGVGTPPPQLDPPGPEPTSTTSSTSTTSTSTPSTSTTTPVTASEADPIVTNNKVISAPTKPAPTTTVPKKLALRTKATRKTAKTTKTPATTKTRRKLRAAQPVPTTKPTRGRTIVKIVKRSTGGAKNG